MRLPIILLSLTTLLSSCIKQGEVFKSAEPINTTVVGVLDPQGTTGVEPLPDRVSSRIEQALRARNLEPSGSAPSKTTAAFEARRVTKQRLAWLSENDETSQLTLLVETSAVYYSQIEGRNRWTVHVSATVFNPRRVDEALTSEFDVPVILQFVHEKAPRAIEEAAPIIERQIGHLLDQYLRATQAPD